jgi:chorismate dehydratase
VRVGRIPYLNSEPFYVDLTGHELVVLPPRALGQAVADGRVDAGPFSLVDLFRLEAALTPLAFGISTPGLARSVVLFSERPVKELDGAVIGVTEETSTSVQILRLLLAGRYGVTPRAWVSAEEPADGVLLIGDRALRALAAPGAPPHRIDIGQEWVEWTGLPCVFARWAVRSAIAPAEREGLALALERALERGLASLPLIAERRRDVALSPGAAEAYLRGFTYRFGPTEDRAIAELRRRLAGLGPS